MIQQELFLALVRLGIGNSSPRSMNALQWDKVDWNALEELAAEQGLSAVMVDGIERMPEELRPPKLVLLQWIGESLQGYEYRYELYCRTIAELAAFYNEHGYKMMVLKGYACSMDWPKSEHRPCGDIDIWLFGKQKEADAVLAKEKGIEIDNSHNRHTIFEWRDFLVENHYDFANVRSHKMNGGLEKVLKKLGEDDSYSTELFGEKVYLPSPNLHALFLIRHATAHFSALGLTIRQLLDWALFVKTHGEEVDWDWLNQVLEQFGMKKLYNIFNAICVEDLGFDVKLFHRVQFEPVLKERVLKEILEPEYGIDLPKGLLRSWIYRWRRWKAGAWKRELCYHESNWETFWNSLWLHLLSPKTAGDE